MHPSSCQRSPGEALQQEATKLSAIAEQLGVSIERFEAFMTSKDAAHHAASAAISSLSGDASDDDCQQLARKLQEERRLLIAAWEQLERDQRTLLKEPELLKVAAEPAQKRAQVAADSTVLPPVAPSLSVSDTNISKRLQFQHLQREIDRHR